MVVPAVLARRLPVPHRRLHHRPLSPLRPADRPRLTRGRRLQPLATDHRRPRFRPVHAIPPEAFGDGSRQEAAPRAGRALPIPPIPEADLPLSA